jgi:hypothetical protein
MEEGRSRHKREIPAVPETQRTNELSSTNTSTKAVHESRGGEGGALLLVARGGVIPRPGLESSEKPGVTIEIVEQEVAREQVRVRVRFQMRQRGKSPSWGRVGRTGWASAIRCSERNTEEGG